MSNINKLWVYQNFNMVEELQISGEFIYDGIKCLSQMVSIDQIAPLFSFLYHLSVGIERIQKIIIVLYEDLSIDNHLEMENKLKTHSQTKLNERVCKLTESKTNAQQNDFLEVLSYFYAKERYHRFNLQSNSVAEKEKLESFIVKYLPDKIQRHFYTNQIIFSDHIKQLLLNVINSLVKTYYDLVRKGGAKHHNYCYELQPGSKAERVFLSVCEAEAAQEQVITEEIALKELLIYLRNAKKVDGLINYIEEIKPLDFGLACLNDYLFSVCKGIVPQELIDEVQQQYDENEYSKDRLKQIGIIGNPQILFELYLSEDNGDDLI